MSEPDSMQTRKTKVIIVDDHEIMRYGVREVLERSGEFDVAGEAADGNAAVTVALNLRPDVIVMDVMMPVKDGIEASREIMGMLPETKVIILTASSEEDAVTEAVAAGARGFIHKFCGKEQLLAAVKDVAKGEYHLPPDAITRAFAGIRSTSRTDCTRKAGRLTNREREILTLFAQGMSYAEIADVRGNKWVTIRNAVYGIQDKLGINTKQELVVWAVQNGLLDGFRAGEVG